MGSFKVNHTACSCKWMWTVFNQISHFCLSLLAWRLFFMSHLWQNVHGANKMNMLLFLPGMCRTCSRVCLKPPLFAPLKIIEMWRSHIKACHQCLASNMQMKQPSCSPEVQMASEWCQIHYNGIWSTLKPLCCCSHWQRLGLWLTMTLFMAVHLLDLYKLRVWLRVLK